MTATAYERCLRVWITGGHLLDNGTAARRARVPVADWQHFRAEREAAGRAEAHACRLLRLPPERRDTICLPAST